MPSAAVVNSMSMEPRIVTRRLQNLTINSGAVPHDSTTSTTRTSHDERMQALTASNRVAQAPLATRLLRNQSLSCRTGSLTRNKTQIPNANTPTSTTASSRQDSISNARESALTVAAAAAAAEEATGDGDGSSIAMSIKLHPRNSIRRSQDEIKSMLTRLRTKHADYVLEQQQQQQQQQHTESPSVAPSNDSVITIDGDESMVRSAANLRKRRSDFNKSERKYELRSANPAHSTHSDMNENGSMLSVDDENNSDSSYSTTTSNSSSTFNLRRHLRR